MLKGVHASTQVRVGNAAQQIVHAAGERDDLIVIGSHGTTGLKRWLLGSVAQKITHTSTVPVLIVREEQPFPSGPFRILVPLDGSLFAEEALQPAAAIAKVLARPSDASVHLVHVVNPVATLGDLSGVMAELNQETQMQAEHYLKSVVQRLHEATDPPFPLPITSEVVSGVDTATVLLNIARKGGSGDFRGVTDGSQMIAMTTRSRRGLSHLVMGSVAQRVLGSTLLPMLIVPPKTEKEVKEQEMYAELPVL